MIGYRILKTKIDHIYIKELKLTILSILAFQTINGVQFPSNEQLASSFQIWLYRPMRKNDPLPPSCRTYFLFEISGH